MPKRGQLKINQSDFTVAGQYRRRVKVVTTALAHAHNPYTHVIIHHAHVSYTPVKQRPSHRTSSEFCHKMASLIHSHVGTMRYRRNSAHATLNSPLQIQKIARVKPWNNIHFFNTQIQLRETTYCVSVRGNSCS